jgi:hypothetical protein
VVLSASPRSGDGRGISDEGVHDGRGDHRDGSAGGKDSNSIGAHDPCEGGEPSVALLQSVASKTGRAKKEVHIVEEKVFATLSGEEAE